MQSVFDARREIVGIHVSDEMERYMADLVNATRFPDGYGDDLKRWIEIGASPRGAIGLDRCSRAHAWMEGRDHVTPQDVQSVAHDILRHRVIVSYEAEARDMTSDDVVAEVFDTVDVP